MKLKLRLFGVVVVAAAVGVVPKMAGDVAVGVMPVVAVLLSSFMRRYSALLLLLLSPTKSAFIWKLGREKE